jgi:hypothetical protein
MTDASRAAYPRSLRSAIAASLAMSIGLVACQTTAPSPTAPLVQESAPPASASATPPSGTPPSSAVPSPTPAASPSGPVAIDPANFTTTIDNPWLPFQPGMIWTYKGVKDGEPIVDTVTVTRDTKLIDGVTCVVVSDILKSGRATLERTSDYYVQDLQGNVWYFGEDTAELDSKGNVTSTEGTWASGVDGAQPGVVMPGSPAIGYSGLQEYLPGHAEDRFVVLLTTAKAKVPFGTFSDVLLTAEWTRLEPGVLTEKAYAKGIGELREKDVTGGDEFQELTKLIKP